MAKIYSYDHTYTDSNEIFTRFLKHISTGKENECWEWLLKKNKKGYGAIVINGYITAAHRYSFFHYIGEIPKGMIICHSCDNPGCVNPSHLFLGTDRDNRIDCVSKNRHNTPKCFTEEQVIEIRKDYIKWHNYNHIARLWNSNARVVRDIVLRQGAYKK